VNPRLDAPRINGLATAVEASVTPPSLRSSPRSAGRARGSDRAAIR
jgi:hypothetical protein